ncbi:hypothetical protein JKA74_15680 [Marivirga sp. S37H4]|uniref:Uncharacterized protein n=1 Tax=Marivirga aurantiaca TaxID=2802615 RepID=A0A935CAA6_9BACT|nr:hypothetical protein [Marivirga aurantiaca]MBK6266485.1 hypothetical protein [Marivirga aurantiaca]
MIVSKPRYQTIFALAVFLVLVFGSFFLLLDSLLYSAEYFIIKIILTPVVLVIALLVLTKFIAALKVIKIGNNKISVTYLISRSKIQLSVADIKAWMEEVVKTRQGEFRETKILYGKKKIIKLSNKENTEYDKIVKYLNTKAGKAKR